MSYPEPIWCESAEELYKQAKFFYNQYEKTNRLLKKANAKIAKLEKQLNKQRCKHHPMEIRSRDEIRAEMKRQDDKVKDEGHWRG